MRTLPRAVVGALVPAGTIAGHVLGYAMAGEDAALHGTHSHLRPAAWVAAAAMAAALATLAMVRPGPSRGGVRLVSLVSAQVALFALVEAGEHVAAGHGAASFVEDPSFRWGVLAQLASGAALVAATWLARASGERVRALLARRPRLPAAPSRRTCGDGQVAAPRRGAGSSVRERGPPRLLATA